MYHSPFAPLNGWLCYRPDHHQGAAGQHIAHLISIQVIAARQRADDRPEAAAAPAARLPRAAASSIVVLHIPAVGVAAISAVLLRRPVQEVRHCLQ